jgi:Tfp pilus assembly protein PilF
MTETIALKALTMQSSLPYPATVSSNAKLAEIEEMARTAVKKDMMSHITWHVLGIMARNRKDYNEASKAYGQARKIDPVSASHRYGLTLMSRTISHYSEIRCLYTSTLDSTQWQSKSASISLLFDLRSVVPG